MFWDLLIGKKRKKVAVILHGYPSPVQKEMPIWRMLEEMGYDVVMPKYMASQNSFSVDNVIRETEKLLNGKKPTVIIGISLGGIILPYLAEKYPKAKLIFAASGRRLKSKMKWFDMAVNLAGGKSGTKITKWLARIPENAVAFGYDMVHKTNDPIGKKVCEMDKLSIIKTLKTTSPDRHMEIARFIREADTAHVLRELNNKALVCVGNQDELMPPEGGEELAMLLKNSQLVKVDAKHFNILNDKTFEEIKRFISS